MFQLIHALREPLSELQGELFIVAAIRFFGLQACFQPPHARRLSHCRDQKSQDEGAGQKLHKGYVSINYAASRSNLAGGPQKAS
jgi:hypothetical protein